VADLLHVQFPWGKLLEGAARPEAWFFSAVQRVLKPGGRFELVLGYDPDSDDRRVREAGLPALDDAVIEDLAEAYRSGGLTEVAWARLSADEIASLQSSWARRLVHGPPRPVYRLTAVKE
jgi:hypothetical protein